jgi:hypothetical protein
MAVKYDNKRSAELHSAVSPSCTEASAGRPVCNRRWQACVAFLFLAFLALNRETLGQTADPLFIDGPQLESVVKVSTDSSSKRVRSASINTRLFVGPDARQNWTTTKIELNLFPDVRPTAVIAQTEVLGPGRWVGYGNIEGEPGSQFTIAAEQDMIAATVFLPRRGTFRILYAGNQLHDISEIDPGRAGLCGIDGVTSPGNLTIPDHPAPIARKSVISLPVLPIFGGSAPTTNLVTILDLMVVYTTEARLGAGNATAMNTLIDLAVAEANTVYQNSEANVRIRLVHRSEVNYAEASSLSTNLNRLQIKDDGFMDEVHMLRDTNRADLVCLITEQADAGVSGLAFTMTDPSMSFRSHAFSVVKRADAVGTFIFVHEISHNLGCQHDREHALDPEGNIKPGAFPYSFGHRFVAGGVTYHDVMAYAPGQAIPYLSNPNVLFMGVPTGLPGITNGANNVLTISNTASNAGAFYGPLVRTAPPQVSLTAPLAQAVLSAETNLDLTAQVSDSDGVVKQVEFYRGNELIGVTTNIIAGLTIGATTNLFAIGVINFYKVVWANIPAGEHALTARAVDTLGASSSSVSVQIKIRPRNDDFAARIALNGAAPTVSGSNRGATLEPNEPMHAGTPGGKSVWYSWTAPKSGTVTLTVQGAGITPLPGIYKSVSATSSTPVTRTLNFDTAQTIAHATFDAVAGGAYTVAIDSPSGTSGDFSLSLGFQRAPENDTFASRTKLLGDTITLAEMNNLAATLEAGEPLHSAPNLGGKSVWFSWNAPRSGTVIVTATTTNFYALLDVYRGNSLSTLTNVAGRRIAFDSTNKVTTLTFDAVAAEDYELAFDGLGGEAGVFNWTLAFPPAPGNDAFTNRISLAGTLASVSASNLYATRESGEPAHFSQPGGRSIWYSWRAPVSGPVTVTCRGDNFFTLLDVYTGNAVTALTNVAGRFVTFNQTNFTSTLTFSAVAYRTYALAVDGFNGLTGAIEMNLKTANLPPAFQPLSSLNPTVSNFRLSLFGSAGQKFAIQASTNLTDWADIFTSAFVTNTFSFSDQESQNLTFRYYRVLALP